MSPESRETMEKALADAKVQRQKLEEWIAVTERLLGIVGDEPTAGDLDLPGGAATAPVPGAPVRADSFFGMTIVAAVKKFLGMKREPQSTSQIVAALKQGGFTAASKDLGNTVYSVLHREWKGRGEVVRVNDAWGLGEWYPGLKRAKKSQKDELGQDSPDGVS